jgi:hypothetical protein
MATGDQKPDMPRWSEHYVCGAPVAFGTLFVQQGKSTYSYKLDENGRLKWAELNADQLTYNNGP